MARCPECDGSSDVLGLYGDGKCRHCHGSGKDWFSSTNEGITGESIECSYCGGSSDCQLCGGSGEIDGDDKHTEDDRKGYSDGLTSEPSDPSDDQDAQESDTDETDDPPLDNEQSETENVDSDRSDSGGRFPKATIHGVAFEMDATENAKLGMAILVDLTIADAREVDCHLGAYFETSDGVPLLDTNGAYRSYDNVVSVGITLIPERVEQYFRSIRLFMPYEELHPPRGIHQLRFYLAIHRWHGTEILATTGFYYWSLPRRKRTLRRRHVA
jgi:hypothetical protein